MRFCARLLTTIPYKLLKVVEELRMLRAPTWSASAKLLWMFLQLEAATYPGRSAGSAEDGQRRLIIAKVAKRSGLVPHTVRRANKERHGGGWATGNRDNGAIEPAVSIPVDLLLDTRPDAQAKLLYGTLQLIPGFYASAGQFTVGELAPLSSVTQKQTRKR